MAGWTKKIVLCLWLVTGVPRLNRQLQAGQITLCVGHLKFYNLARKSHNAGGMVSDGALRILLDRSHTRFGFGSFNEGS